MAKDAFKVQKAAEARRLQNPMLLLGSHYIGNTCGIVALSTGVVTVVYCPGNYSCFDIKNLH
jgi:hypothetical protein